MAVDATSISKLLLTVPEAAKALSISPRSLWAMTSPRGPIPAVRFSRSVRYSPQALQAWIDSQNGHQDGNGADGRGDGEPSA